MNVTEYLASARLTIDDPGAVKFTDAALLRAANTHVRSMFRDTSKADDNYHNCDLNLVLDRFVQSGGDVWDYPMPSWVDKVLMVWARQRGASVEDHESPAMVRGANGLVVAEQHAGPIRPSSQRRLEPGYVLVGQTVFRLVNFSQPQTLMVQTTKVPAGVTRGTVDFNSGDAGMFFLRSNALATDADGLQALERGAYRNARFEFTGAAGDTGEGDALSGCVRTCVHSQLDVTQEGGVTTKRVRIYLDAPLPRAPIVGDRYESVLEIPAADERYLILLVARQCFVQQASVEGLKSIEQELREERARFVDHITPRQMQEPKFAVPDYDFGRSTSDRSFDCPDNPTWNGY